MASNSEHSITTHDSQQEEDYDNRSSTSHLPANGDAKGSEGETRISEETGQSKHDVRTETDEVKSEDIQLHLKAQLSGKSIQESINPEIKSIPTVQSIIEPACNHNSIPIIGSPQVTIDQQLQKASRDLEAMVINYAKSERENIRNKQKVDELERKLARAVRDNDQLANRLKISTADKNQLIATMSEKVARLTVLEQKKSLLDNLEGEKQKEYEDKIAQLEGINSEMIKQIESSKIKHGELLEFSELLSMKYVLLQTELEQTVKRGPSYKEQYDLVLEDRNRLLEETKRLSEQVTSLELSLRDEEESARNHREERVKEGEKYRSKIDELENEIKVMRRKYLMSNKELTKELKVLRMTLDKVMPTGPSEQLAH